MNAVSIDIKDILEAESSLGLVFASNLFISREPTSPDNCTTIYDIAGQMPDLTLGGQSYKRDSFQVRVRNNSYQEAMTLVYQISEFLQGKHSEVWNGTSYKLIRETIPAFPIGYDDNNRVMIVINFEAQRADV